jgi:hypothetical protein
MIDREQHGSRFARGGTEVDRGLAAVRADLEQGPERAGRERGVVQRETFVVGHKALGGTRRFQQRGVHHASALRTATTSARCSDLVVTRMRSNSGPEILTSA